MESMHQALHRYSKELWEANDINATVKKLLRYAQPTESPYVFEFKVFQLPKNIVQSAPEIFLDAELPIPKLRLETITVRFITTREDV
jgi:predicted subunit of tRNA(5-methylaminomethyl-2-thiouridylate) methyltransferase